MHLQNHHRDTRETEEKDNKRAVHTLPASNLIKVTNKPINTLHSMSLY